MFADGASDSRALFLKKKKIRVHFSRQIRVHFLVCCSSFGGLLRRTQTYLSLFDPSRQQAELARNFLLFE